MNSTFQLPGYEILGKLGSGGMSTVWKARQLSLDRLVAIKTLAPEYLPDADALQRFRIEAQAAARLNHPGIVQVYDAGEINKVPYIIMEYVDGRSVGDMLADRGKLPEQVSLKIVESVSYALGYAWDKDCIIHCDIKPDNLLVTADGGVKVVDLGLARFIGLQRRAVGDLIVGTPNYTAPEQSEGVPDLDCRVDIYSLGATLYHMVTGVLPFGGSPGSTAMDRHVHDFLPDPLEHNPHLSVGTAWLIEKMMVKDRADRPAYWRTVSVDVRDVLTGGMPKPPLPKPGKSTVARSGRRLAVSEEILADPAAPSATPTPVAPAPAAPKKRIVVSSDIDEHSPMRRRRDGSLASKLLKLAILGALAGGVYAFFHSGMNERYNIPHPREWPKFLQPVEPIAPAPTDTSDASSADAPSPATPSDAWTPPSFADDDADAENRARPVTQTPVDAPPPSGTEGETVTWKNADFLRGARAFNRAIEMYKQYQETRENPAVLSRVEALAREAIRSFEACKNLAPPDVDIPGHISNCFKLIADVRHSTLMDNPSAARERASATASRTAANEAALPAPPSSVGELPSVVDLARRAAEVTEGAEEAPAPVPSPARVAPSARAVGDELRTLLGAQGLADPNAVLSAGTPIVGRVACMMTAATAARELGAGPGLKRPLLAPGFSGLNLSFYGLRGDFGDGFDLAMLVVDATDRVLAVQFSTERPLPPRLAPDRYAKDWKVHNFLLIRTKSKDEFRVGHQVQKRDEIIVIDTELVEAEGAKTKERVKLYLPQALVNQVLARLESAN